MRPLPTLTRWAMVAAILALGAWPGWAQEREYHVVGKVLDVNKQPVAGATVEMRERTSRPGSGPRATPTGSSSSWVCRM